MMLQRIASITVEAVASTAGSSYFGLLVDDFRDTFKAAEEVWRVGRKVDQHVTPRSGCTVVSEAYRNDGGFRAGEAVGQETDVLEGP